MSIEETLRAHEANAAFDKAHGYAQTTIDTADHRRLLALARLATEARATMGIYETSEAGWLARFDALETENP